MIFFGLGCIIYYYVQKFVGSCLLIKNLREELKTTYAPQKIIILARFPECSDRSYYVMLVGHFN